jgi:hypothetical protein
MALDHVPPPFPRRITRLSVLTSLIQQGLQQAALCRIFTGLRSESDFILFAF